jgi:hypothetical protein
LESIDLKTYCTEDIGLPTLKDRYYSQKNGKIGLDTRKARFYL